MSRIFISYRRQDGQHVVDRIHDHLSRKFGPGELFKDVGSIPIGRNFRDVIEGELRTCRLVLVVIGPGWLDATDSSGRRLDNPSDPVRTEIETALQREISLIPVCVGDTLMPRPEELPAPIVNLAYLNAIRIRPDPDFSRDIGRLVVAMNEHLSDDFTTLVPARLPIDDPRQLGTWGPEIRRSLLLLESLAMVQFVACSGPEQRLQMLAFGEVIVDLEAPADALFVHQVERVLDLAVVRGEREREISARTEERLPFWANLAALVAERRPQTRELLEAATAFATLIQGRFKYAFGVARPVEWASQVMPRVASAAGGSYPMGAAIEAYLVVRVVEVLAGERAVSSSQLRRMAHRVSENQIVAGHNFPVDAVAGRDIGLALGDYFLARCGATDFVEGIRVEAGKLNEDTAFQTDASWTPESSPNRATQVTPSAALHYLWNSARAEWVSSR